MFKKLFYLFISISLPLLGEAKIIETYHIADVMPLIDDDTWVLVDLDNTFFEAKQALGHTLWFFDEVDQRMQKGMSRDDAIRDMYPYWIQTQRITAVQPLEPDFVPSMLALQNRGIIVMGLTARQLSVAGSTARQVNSLGFDFKKTAPSKDSFSVPGENHPGLYFEGILFVSDFNKKGDVLLPFLSIVKQKPKKVVFLDDKKKNVEDLEATLSKEGIEYIGVYYTAIDRVKPVFSREVAQFQFKFLEKIMSNEAAMTLMENKIFE